MFKWLSMNATFRMTINKRLKLRFCKIDSFAFVSDHTHERIRIGSLPLPLEDHPPSTEKVGLHEVTTLSGEYPPRRKSCEFIRVRLLVRYFVSVST